MIDVPAAVGQEICSRGFAAPGVAIVKVGGVYAELSRLADTIDIVERGIVRAVEIIEALVNAGSRRHGDRRDIVCPRPVVVERIKLLQQILTRIVALIGDQILAVAAEIRGYRRVVP